ncbi:MAG: glycosyltransferase [Bacteroidales bacterium]|nr:glycosyltransferase [Bacteroidales bacterium]
MKVLLVSTSDKIGGAAIACTRIFAALRKSGVDARMLVRDKISSDPDIHSVNTGVMRRTYNFLAFCMERLRLLFHLGFRKKNLFQVSLDNWGTWRLHDNPLVLEADVINFHWTSQAMLSLGQLQKLIDMGKKVIFTMHDMHHFTGICHYAGSCTRFQQQCGNCQYINGGKNANDLSRRWLRKKLSMPIRQNITYVACSRWLADTAKTSSLMQGADVVDIPNPIDTVAFCRMDRGEARARFGVSAQKVILFGAVNIADSRKGFRYLQMALQHISAQNPDCVDDIELLIFGKCDEAALDGLPFPHIMAGYLSSLSDLRAVYSAADVYVTPSLEDNLPNTVMEAMACGTPCVSFDIGGLPQLIDHLDNGYVAKYKDHEDLADGIMHIIGSLRHQEMMDSARRKVEDNFSEAVVAARYLDAYNKL